MTPVVRLTLYYEILCYECFIVFQRSTEVANEYGERVQIKYNACSQAPIPDEIKSIFAKTDGGKVKFMGRTISFDGPPKATTSLAEMADDSVARQHLLLPLRSLKAAEFQLGTDAHARLLGCMYHAHFDDGDDFTALETIITCATKIGLEAVRFQDDIESQTSLAAVLTDRFDAEEIGIFRMPTVVYTANGLFQALFLLLSIVVLSMKC